MRGVSQKAEYHAYESKRLTPAVTRMGKLCETISSAVESERVKPPRGRVVKPITFELLR